MGSKPFAQSASSIAAEAMLALKSATAAITRATNVLVDDDGVIIKRARTTSRRRAQRNALEAMDALVLFMRANGTALANAERARKPASPEYIHPISR